MSVADSSNEVLAEDGSSAARSPALNAAPLLRGAAMCAVLAAAAGVILSPGLRGNARESIVVAGERVAGSLSFLLYGLLIALLIRGAFELVRNPRIHIASRVVLVLGAGVTSAMAAPALHGKLPPIAAVVLTLGALVAVVPGAWNGIRAPHTRAVGVVLFVFALAALARLGAWELDATGSHPERPLPRVLAMRDYLGGAAIVLEGLGQLAAAAWLSTRGRFAGQGLAAAAIAGAFALTWGVAQGIHAHAAPWQAVMHTALADVAAIPAPLGAIATFLVCASILLALVAAVTAVQQAEVAAVVCALSLALVSRGAFDAPLRALSAVAAAMWLTVAMADDRAMWRSLMLAPKPRA
jgi:hypothetical protein